MLKKMLWEVGVYSHLSERLIKDGRGSAARRVVSGGYNPQIPLNSPPSSPPISPQIASLLPQLYII